MIKVLEDEFEICNYTNKKIDYNANNVTVKDKNYMDFKCEIQLVTVMSHNLIEIGHDIFYKNSENLKTKDAIEYEYIKADYEHCLKEVYKLETRIENIKMRAENIKHNYSLFKLVISEDYIKGIELNTTAICFNKVCNELGSLVQFLYRNEEKAKIFIKKNIFNKLTKLLKKLENDEIFSKELIFENYMKLLYQYSSFWIGEEKNILGYLISYLSVENNNQMDKSFFEMIKKSVINNIKEGSWIFFDKIREWILEDFDYPKYRLKIANCIINNEISYIEQSEISIPKIITKFLIYNDNGNKAIEEIFNHCCKIFVQNQNKTIYNELITLVYKKTTLSNQILNFFDEYYIEINDIYKFDLVRKIYCSFENELLSNKYLEKVKQDKICYVYICLTYEHYDSHFSKIESEDERFAIIRKYIKSINSKDYNEISRLLRCYELLSTDDNSLNEFQLFIFNIGKKYNHAKRLYSLYKNPYLYLGIRTSSKTIKERKDIEVLKALKNVFVEKEFLNLLMQRKPNIKKDSMICNIIISRELYIKSKFKKSLFNIISYYNKKKKYVLKCFLSSKFINSVTSKEMDIILENIKYNTSNFDYDFSIVSMKIFEKYPQKIRDFIVASFKRRRNNNSKFPMRLYITNAANYENERENNILMILELLKRFEYFEIYKYVDDLFLKGDINIASDLLKILQSISSNKMKIAISKFINESGLGLKSWDVAKIILQNSNSIEINDLLYNALTNDGAVNSFVDVSVEKVNKLRKIRKNEKNVKLKVFLDRLICYYSQKRKIEELRELKFKTKLEIKSNF